MPGKLLRTNYRRTGGMPDIIAIGGAIPKSSYAGAPGGIGTNEPFGGFMVFDYSGSFQGAEATGNMFEGSGPAGCSNAWCESTKGAMSLFYGDGMFGEGYVFLPLGMDVYAYSDTTISTAGGDFSTAGAGVQYFRPIRIYRIHTSASYFIVSAFVQSCSAGFSLTQCSEASFKARVYGFIISAP